MKQVRRSVKQILFSLTLVMVFFINIHPVMAQEISNESKNAIWNEKKLMKKSGKRVGNNRMNTELKRCIIMSHYVKRYFYENVYKEKLS